MLASSYTGLISWSFGSSGVTSMNFTSSPIEVNRSVTAGVGRPPDQTKPSSEPSFMPSTVLVRSSRCALTSLGFSPATSIIRFAITSVPDREPVEILALEVLDRVDAESACTTTWV